jgi:hypothetical protein
MRGELMDIPLLAPHTSDICTKTKNLLGARMNFGRKHGKHVRGQKQCANAKSQWIHLGLVYCSKFNLIRHRVLDDGCLHRLSGGTV